MCFFVDVNEPHFLWKLWMVKIHNIGKRPWILSFNQVYKTIRLLTTNPFGCCIYISFKISTFKEFFFNIHLTLHLEIFNGYNYKHSLNWFHSYNKGKSFIEINTFNLCKSPSHQMSLVLCHKAINIIFDFENSIAIHWFATRWKRSKYLVHLNLSSNIHIKSPTSSKNVVDLSYLLNNKSNPNLLHYLLLLLQKIKTSYNNT